MEQKDQHGNLKIVLTVEIHKRVGVQLNERNYFKKFAIIVNEIEQKFQCGCFENRMKMRFKNWFDWVFSVGAEGVAKVIIKQYRILDKMKTFL